MGKLPSFTRSQLALRNGQDRPEVWVAYLGTIYDVTKSRMWRDGKHYEHWAGQDLTAEFADAPHTTYVFDKFREIGTLIENENENENENQNENEEGGG